MKDFHSIAFPSEQGPIPRQSSICSRFNEFPINQFPQRVGTWVTVEEKQIVRNYVSNQLVSLASRDQKTMTNHTLNFNEFPINQFPQRVGTEYSFDAVIAKKKFPINQVPQRVGTYRRNDSRNPRNCGVSNQLGSLASRDKELTFLRIHLFLYVSNQLGSLASRDNLASNQTSKSDYVSNQLGSLASRDSNLYRSAVKELGGFPINQVPQRVGT